MGQLAQIFSDMHELQIIPFAMRSHIRMLF